MSHLQKLAHRSVGRVDDEPQPAILYGHAGQPTHQHTQTRWSRGTGPGEVEETNEPVKFVERVAALDIGKAAVLTCIRVPHEDKAGTARRQENG